MFIHKRVPYVLIGCLIFTGLLSSCYKKQIQVGSDLAESYTRIITVDTVGVMLSSYVLDSFITNDNKYALIGNYHDTYTGNTAASTYFQVGLPFLSEDATTLLPPNAMFDSLVLDMRPSGYYYGDTTKPFAITVSELAEQPEYKYGTDIYNTSSTPVKSGSLATFSRTLRPSLQDSIKIRLPNSMGQDFFNKIQEKAPQVANEAAFLDYFRGFNIRPSNSSGAAVYGFNLADSSVRVRLHYHLTIPTMQDRVLEFVIARSSYQFNRIVTNRTGTPLQPTTPEQREFPATSTNQFAITQAGTGVLLKAKFPSLRELLKINDVVRLMDAKLILQPVNGTYDRYINKLPAPLFLQTTNATNSVTGVLQDTTGQGAQFRFPVIDELYGTNTTYTFNITSYINALLNTPGSADNGLFIIDNNPEAAKQIDRGVIGSRDNIKYQTKLILNILTIE